MISIVNSTHDQVLQHQHILTLQHYIEKVSDQINIIEGLMKTRANLLQFLHAKLKVEQVLSAMTASHTHWLRQVAMFERQKASLELGFLTEDLIAKKELMRIVNSRRKMGYYAPQLEWYYAHIRVSPITQTDTSLIFCIKLPLTMCLIKGIISPVGLS